MRFVALSFVLGLAAQTLANPIPASPEEQWVDVAAYQGGRLPALNAPSQGLKPEHGPAGRRGAVATEIDVCSNVGADLLKRGGSAADAAIGASLCVGVVAAFHSGIGGGGFALIRTAHGHYSEVDFRETAPALSNQTMYEDTNKSSTIGGLSVGTPGELRGWEALHAKHGLLPWKDIFQPAIQIGRYGFKVPSQLSVFITQYADQLLCKEPLWAEVYCPGGKAAQLGDTIKRIRYADTLEIIAEQGVDAFYHGPIANRTVATVQASGGILTQADLAAYKVVHRKPAHIQYGRHKVVSTVAPSSGTVVLNTLNVIGQYEDLQEVGTNLTTHRLIEATKWAYATRAHLADPDFIKNVSQIEWKSITDESARKIKAEIRDNKTFPPAHYNPERIDILTDSGTSQLSVVAADGSAVTLTTTINLIWGSQLITPDGIILNDEMDDFSRPGGSNAFGYVAASANFIKPGKRPLSSMSPVIAEKDGQISFALGSAGGSRIITANIINSFNALNGVDLQDSLAQPRWHNQLLPATTVLEWADSDPKIPGWVGYSNSTAAFLAGLGHNISYAAPGSSTAQGVQRKESGLIKGAHEPRQLSSGAAGV
ncbi:gamma-glutamyltranspeptidase [Ceraceosorus bombacis]|uniref:Glutathione hydrolase n=1 Tax=Ceraceosorus bombacis TaxID=401625 RepID=A0A0P1BLK4_9BASI|nr:gamma-glutamyltranspeptidase [Ceraceosorus bombacis]